MTTVAYEFPSPAERNAWEETINEAIVAKTLRWSHIEEEQWRLDGTCPRCAHPFGEVFDFNVVISETFSAAEFKVDKKQGGDSQNPDVVAAEVVCACEPDLPHRKDTKGCGAGAGLEIRITKPTRPTPAGAK